jgi:cyclophilin family peptidyl-prolyl cis-trans isomerase
MRKPFGKSLPPLGVPPGRLRARDAIPSRLPNSLTRRDLRWLLSCAVAAGLAAPACYGQPIGDERVLGSATLRPEIVVPRPLYQAGQPVRVCFLLVNPTGEPQTFATRGSSDGDAGLPLGAILGTEDQPALMISFEDERAVAVRPPGATGDSSSKSVVRVTPRGVVGAELDLHELHRALGYAGAYRLEWRPLDGAIGTATARFRIERRWEAVMITDYGKMTFALQYERAPINVENFLELVRDRFYDRKSFHRIMPGFLIQGGRHAGGGIRPDGKLVPAELSDQPFDIGTLAMARKPTDLNSASCQFFICLGRAPELDGQYTIIGQARDEESLRTLQKLAALPVDANHRPLSPPAIRTITLVEPLARSETQTRPMSVDLSAPRHP